MRTLVIILLLCSSQLKAQSKYKLDVDSFLLGMIDSQDGRLIPLDNEEKASYIATVKNQKLSIAFLDTISKYFKVPKAEITKREFSFYNKNLAKHFNEYFISEVDSGMTYVDPKNGKEYYIHVLSLNERKFQDFNKKLSFLAGVFYQCGTLSNGEVTFRTNSSANFGTAVHFISQLGFAYCEIARQEYYIDAVQQVTFKPNDEYIECFNEMAKLKNINGL
jgi:hypothetical protein